MTDREIAGRYGVSASAVHHWRAHHGIPARPARGRPYGGPPPATLAGMVRNGMRDRAIARRLGVGASTVQAWRARFGIAPVGASTPGTIAGIAELAARSLPTRRQVEAIQQIAYGRNLEQAAARLGISRSGVDQCLGRARERTGARTTAQLVAAAYRAGLIVVPPRRDARKLRPPTRKHAEVVQLYADGMRGPEIAAALWLDTQSVRDRTQTARAWAGAATTAHLVALLLSRGQIE